MLQNTFSNLKNFLIDTHTASSIEVTDIIVFRKKLLKFLHRVERGGKKKFSAILISPPKS